MLPLPLGRGDYSLIPSRWRQWSCVQPSWGGVALVVKFQVPRWSRPVAVPVGLWVWLLLAVDTDYGIFKFHAAGMTRTR